jgi:hypothetical protein
MKYPYCCFPTTLWNCSMYATYVEEEYLLEFFLYPQYCLAGVSGYQPGLSFLVIEVSLVRLPHWSRRESNPPHYTTAIAPYHPYGSSELPLRDLDIVLLL